MRNKIYTHNIATEIVELFEDVLDANGIKIPSPDDDQRDEDNEACLFGETYSVLLDNTETILIKMLEAQVNGAEIVKYVYR